MKTFQIEGPRTIIYIKQKLEDDEILLKELIDIINRLSIDYNSDNDIIKSLHKLIIDAFLPSAQKAMIRKIGLNPSGQIVPFRGSLASRPKTKSLYN